MEIVAIIDFIISKISRKAILRECGFEEDESVNLIILILCFIMEKSLLDENCTKEDIASYIRVLDSNYLKKNISDDYYMKLTDYIIKDCIQNSGVPHYFNSYDYYENKKTEINIKLIDDKRVTKNGNKIFSFYLTPQGYKFMFNTLEIEESMQVSIEQLKLSIAIHKKNFSSARDNVDNLFNICRSQIQKINYFIKKVKEDIGTAGIEEYEDIYNNTFDSIKEQKEGYENLFKIIEATEQSLINDDKLKGSRELAEDIANIIYIKNRLKYIITEQSDLLLKQQELQRVYNEAIDNILYIGFENRLNLEEDLLNRIEQNPQCINAITSIMRPLFKPSPNKIYNINRAYREQKVVSEENPVDNANMLYTEEFFSKTESEKDIKIKQMNSFYIDILETIFLYMYHEEYKAVSLSTILQHIMENGKESYRKFIPDVRVLMNVLIQLHNIKTVDVTKIIKNKEKTIFNPSEEFDIKYTLLQLLDKHEEYNNIKNLRIETNKDKVVKISNVYIDEDVKIEEFNTTQQLICPELVFIAEVER
jgi:hypothetical protein